MKPEDKQFKRRREELQKWFDTGKGGPGVGHHVALCAFATVPMLAEALAAEDGDPLRSVALRARDVPSLATALVVRPSDLQSAWRLLAGPAAPDKAGRVLAAAKKTVLQADPVWGQRCSEREARPRCCVPTTHARVHVGCTCRSSRRSLPLQQPECRLA